MEEEGTTDHEQDTSLEQGREQELPGLEDVAEATALGAMVDIIEGAIEDIFALPSSALVRSFRTQLLSSLSTTISQVRSCRLQTLIKQPLEPTLSGTLKQQLEVTPQLVTLNGPTSTESTALKPQKSLSSSTISPLTLMGSSQSSQPPCRSSVRAWMPRSGSRRVNPVSRPKRST